MRLEGGRREADRIPWDSSVSYILGDHRYPSIVTSKGSSLGWVSDVEHRWEKAAHNKTNKTALRAVHIYKRHRREKI